MNTRLAPTAPPPGSRGPPAPSLAASPFPAGAPHAQPTACLSPPMSVAGGSFERDAARISYRFFAGAVAETAGQEWPRRCHRGTKTLCGPGEVLPGVGDSAQSAAGGGGREGGGNAEG